MSWVTGVGLKRPLISISCGSLMKVISSLSSLSKAHCPNDVKSTTRN